MQIKRIGWCLIWSIFLTYHVVSENTDSSESNDILLFTVASNETDGFKRYIRSTEVYGFRDRVRVLGLGKEWRGGNVKTSRGGGYKINLFKDALKKYHDDKERIVIFTDSYDVIFLTPLSEIIEKFKETEARILFSAEGSCWPDRSLASKYPHVTGGKRYLNSGGFMGYAFDIFAILNTATLEDHEDDQLFYTNIYLDEELREKHKIKLDHKSEIFQNLYGAVADVELIFKGQEAYLQNTVYNTIPLIVHGNGYSKLALNSLGNYLARAWSPEEGCLNCWDDVIELDVKKPDAFPIILVALFVDIPVPFLEEFLLSVYRQTYPKSKLHLFIHNNVPYHEQTIQEFIDTIGEEYLSVKQIFPSDDIDEVHARNLAMDYCLLKDCTGYFSVDAIAHLDNEHALKLLVEQQRNIVAPLLVRPYKAWSNFWGAITDDGFYARSFDYMEIVKNERR
ncbi:hypothetical protein HZH68_007923 [Vespula germanica]|uniref:PLOD1-3-like GT domain-containing protein n=2 Tax=Vespula TaxID=7451 RepID=A0A834K8J6_VESGE|nr:hypothetical protein HZH68_007923 [Vespula germanica]